MKNEEMGYTMPQNSIPTWVAVVGLIVIILSIITK